MLAANHKEEMDEWLNEIKKCMEEDQGSTNQRYKLQKAMAGGGGGGGGSLESFIHISPS